MNWYTHINRGVIDANRKNNTNNPPIVVKKGKRGQSQYAFEVELPAGTRLVYSPHKPILSCGARLVAVSTSEPKVIK
jgi:hypothetical protein